MAFFVFAGGHTELLFEGAAEGVYGGITEQCGYLGYLQLILENKQARRFKERENNPEKLWKITDEDWRNRAKWAEYEDAVNEMIGRTNTDYAPWIIVEANSKMYARLKVLKTIIDALEKKLKAK